MPDENEQFEAYKKVIKGMGGRPVTIRTFDLGGDKAVDATAPRPIRPWVVERSVSLWPSPRCFQIQLRAILRASKFGPVKLLIPMLAHAHEIDQTLAALEQAKSSLRGEKIAFDENIEVGGMIEIPAAALAVGLFMRRLDFLPSAPTISFNTPWPSTVPTSRFPPFTTRCTRRCSCSLPTPSPAPKGERPRLGLRRTGR